jgi:hypothetical protein
MTVAQLLEHGLGQDPKIERDLDLDPPLGLLHTLEQRTGITTERAAQMRLAGWTPWLLDSLQPRADAFETYVRQFSVLLKPGRRSKRRAGDWTAWLSADRTRRSCPRCVSEPDRQGLRLMWQLPLALSCPEHGVMLEPFIGFPGEYFAWTREDEVPRTASEAILAMDRRTEQALTAGHVELPDRDVHAGVWFRLLRTLLDEVSTPVTCWGSRAADLALIWNQCGHPICAGATIWRPYESFPAPIQAQLLAAAAHAIALLENGAVRGRGTHAELFFPVHEAVDDGQPPRPTPKDAFTTAMDQAYATLQAAIKAAQEDPAQAQALYDVLAGACQAPQALAQVRADLAELGIPIRSPVTQPSERSVLVT